MANADNRWSRPRAAGPAPPRDPAVSGIVIDDRRRIGRRQVPAWAARSAEGAQHASETPIRADVEAQRATRIKGARSQGKNAELRGGLKIDLSILQKSEQCHRSGHG